MQHNQFILDMIKVGLKCLHFNPTVKYINNFHYSKHWNKNLYLQISNSYQLKGHRQTGSTDCPG